jgi:hypothetical protein
MDSESQGEDIIDLDFGDLNITEQDDLFLDEAAGHIQENLEDELVQEALKKGLDLRKYSREIEVELRKEENQSIDDCILLICVTFSVNSCYSATALFAIDLEHELI